MKKQESKKTSGKEESKSNSLENQNQEKKLKLFLFELKRQLVHIILGMLIVIAAAFNRTVTLWFIFIVLLLTILFSLISLKYDVKILKFILGKFERRESINKKPFKGAIFYLAGSLLVLKLFSLDVALASIIILAFGDSVPNLIGIYGKIKLPVDNKKTLEGLVAGVLIATFLASFIVSPFEALAASIFAMLAEALSLKLQEEEVDDNIIVPLVAGTVILILRNL